MLATLVARAYVSWGRWVASCPNPDCESAEEVHPWLGYQCGHRNCRHTGRERTFMCSACRLVAPIEWPPNADELWSALEERPKVENRNWFPAEHELALRWGVPHGQSVNDLRREHARMTDAL